MSAQLTVLCGELPGAGGGLPTAAALAVTLAGEPGERGAVLLIDASGDSGRGPTMLASAAARDLERTMRGAGFEAAARGRVAWASLGATEREPERIGECVDAAGAVRAVLIVLPVEIWPALLARDAVRVDAVLLRASLPAQRALAALAVRELRAGGLRVRIAACGPGRVGTRRALAGVDPGGEAARRSARLARGLLGPAAGIGSRPVARRRAAEEGQALPMVLGAAFLLILCALALAALGGAASGKARAQRTADLAALSAARSMRDDFASLFAPPRLGDGSLNPAHLSPASYLARARAAAIEAAGRNGSVPSRVAVGFPGERSFAPLRVRVAITAGVLGDRGTTRVHAVAEAVPPSAATDASQGSATADGGGYGGPLAYRGGEPMRPDVAAAFDRLASAARADGIPILVTSGYRSDAEQAALFAANPDPRWVAPPGRSLHRCATELDLGPPAAYSWLAANAPRFGFVRRYSWEAWHFGYDAGAPPCSAAGNRTGKGDGRVSGGGLPAFVPPRFRAALALAADRWNVSASLLAAQLMAESNFNPYAVSPAGAEGIAQFMPATALAYGLRDPFDAAAAIDAQAHLMADLLDRFDGAVPLALAGYNAGPAAVAACSCVPSYPETQAYVARIMGLMNGAGAIIAPALDIRLVR